MSVTNRSNMNIINIEQSGDIMTFTVENINMSLANAVRRTILSNIPCVVFKTTPYNENQVNIIENTSRIHNEMFKQRISCIPIHISEPDFEMENYIVELHKTNDTDDIMYVTTEDLRIKNIITEKYLLQTDVNKIFPPDKFTGNYIILTRLRPKLSEELHSETINMQAKFSIGTAEENSCFNVVSTCAYGMTPDNIKGREAWNDYEHELKEKNTSSEDIEFEKQNWMLHNAKRYVKNDSFDFIIETIGIYDNVTLVNKAIEIIINKLRLIIQNCDEQTIEIRNGETSNKTYDVILENESYTIGKIIEYILHKLFYKETDILSFVGFRKLHPHDNFSIIRISFNDITTDKSEIYNLMKLSCINLINEFQIFKSFF